MPWPAEYCIQTAGSIVLEKNLAAESEEKEELRRYCTGMVAGRFSSSAHTVVLRKQIFSNSSSSVQGGWQIANCCVPTCETCTYIGRWEYGYMLYVLLTS